MNDRPEYEEESMLGDRKAKFKKPSGLNKLSILPTGCNSKNYKNLLF